MTLRLCLCVASSTLMVSIGSALAQDAGSSVSDVEGLQFDVVSIRLSPIQAPLGYQVSPGRFSVAATGLKDLISSAYEMRKERVFLPEWTRPLFFSIEARMPPETTQQEFREMLRSMLEERFSLRARRESRTMPVLLLLRARKDGSLGPQLTAVQRDCSEPSACPESQMRGVLEAKGRTWEQLRLASFVSGFVGDIVLDRTGLSGGQFDLSLRWQFDLGADANLDSDRPSDIRGALEEQLGLKLERAEELVEVLVVENVAMPSAN